MAHLIFAYPLGRRKRPPRFQCQPGRWTEKPIGQKWIQDLLVADGESLDPVEPAGPQPLGSPAWRMSGIASAIALKISPISSRARLAPRQ